MTKIGYARVSTLDQNLDSQLDELNKADCTKIFQEKASSVKKRPEFEKCLDYCRRQVDFDTFCSFAFYTSAKTMISGSSSDDCRHHYV